MSKRIRADQLLVNLGLVASCAKAQALIMAGVVFNQEQKIVKPSELFADRTVLMIRKNSHAYVGRAGLKLKAILDHLHLNLADKICLDVGASTGGFTDCLLQSGAKKVYALDVGYGQLAWTLRQDDRVVVLDRCNFRYFEKTLLCDPIDVITMDVSFISAIKLLPNVVKIFSHATPATGIFILLVKPQFEVAREHVGEGGIVRDESRRLEVVQKITLACEDGGFKLLATLPSPLLGKDGNQEYLLAYKMG